MTNCMKKEFLQICEDAWGRYESLGPAQRNVFDGAFDLIKDIAEMPALEIEEALPQMDEKLSGILGTIFALAAFRQRVDFVGGKYRVRPKAAPENETLETN